MYNIKLFDLKDVSVTNIQKNRQTNGKLGCSQNQFIRQALLLHHIYYILLFIKAPNQNVLISFLFYSFTQLLFLIFIFFYIGLSEGSRNVYPLPFYWSVVAVSLFRQQDAHVVTAEFMQKFPLERRTCKINVSFSV